MIDSSSEPVVASTIDCAVPAGKTMTIVSGSVPCSIVSFWGEVAARGGGADGDAMGFAEGCAAARAAVDVVCCELVGIASNAGVRGMLMKSTYSNTNAITKDRHSATPIVSADPLRDPCR
jgi:hypothetical protein